MILQKLGNMDVVSQKKTAARADCHSVACRPASEGVGMVACSQPPTKLILEDFQIFRGQAGALPSTYYVRTIGDFPLQWEPRSAPSFLGKTRLDAL